MVESSEFFFPNEVHYFSIVALQLQLVEPEDDDARLAQRDLALALGVQSTVNGQSLLFQT